MYSSTVYLERNTKMHEIDTTIGHIVQGSLAEEAGICSGDKILSINGHAFRDILEYRYLISEYEVELIIEKSNGEQDGVIIESNYEDLGIEFEQGLVDIPQSCHNKCMFCFIDQLPKGMRETVYFKDDDTRLSFLQGNYVTLTNLNDDDIDRLIQMRISPINISVHTTNPELRIKMLGNRFAGRVYEIMSKFAQSNIHMNCQIVLCPGINDGNELDRSINDMAALYPYIDSIAVVPVGLTRYREGLCPLTTFDSAGSRTVIAQIELHQQRLLKNHGVRLVYLSDEFYLNAGMPIPMPEEYEGFPQIENGVGLMASMKEEILSAIEHVGKTTKKRSVLLATGEIAYPFICDMTAMLMDKAPNMKIDVYSIKNEFFGGGVNVAGLVCGRDIINQLKDKPKYDNMFLPRVMLRDGEDIFLDDVTVAQLEQELGVKLDFIENDGYDFVEKILDEEVTF